VGVLSDDITGQGPGTLASFAHRKDFSREGGKAVMVQEFNCGQIYALPTEAERRWVSGYKGYYKFVLGPGAKAKSMTTAPAAALVKAEQLTFSIVRVSVSLDFYNSLNSVIRNITFMIEVIVI
jgi:hypothetical protein